VAYYNTHKICAYPCYYVGTAVGCRAAQVVHYNIRLYQLQYDDIGGTEPATYIARTRHSMSLNINDRPSEKYGRSSELSLRHYI